MHALPGGFVEIGETVEDACRRELMEETGVRAGKLQLLGVYSNPGRDPRGHTCSIVFLTRVRRATPRAGDDAAAAEWVESWSKVELAFDHGGRLVAPSADASKAGGLTSAGPKFGAATAARSHADPPVTDSATGNPEAEANLAVVEAGGGGAALPGIRPLTT